MAGVLGVCSVTAGGAATGSGWWGTAWRRPMEDGGRLGDGVEEVSGGRRPAWGQRGGGWWRAAGDVNAVAARIAGDGMEEVDGGRHKLGDGARLGLRRCRAPRWRQAA